jgi:hypothetical protein
MRKRYKVVLNLEIDDPGEPHPAGGSYTHLNNLQGAIVQILYSLEWVGHRYMKARVTLDKIIDKGEILEEGAKLAKDTELIQKERVFYCPVCCKDFNAVGYLFYTDLIAKCPRCGDTCWEKTVKITLTEYERLKRIGAKPKIFH